jgi:cullin 1
VIHSFLLFGLDKDINKVSLDVYKEHLEKPFLGATGKDYKQEPEPCLAEGTLSDYLRRAGERLKEEDRVDQYLRTEMRQHLVRVLIRQHNGLIWESHSSLHDFDRDEDLQKMHTFLPRTPEDLQPLAEKFKEHVRKSGLATFAKLLDEQSDCVDSLDLKSG